MHPAEVLQKGRVAAPVWAYWLIAALTPFVLVGLVPVRADWGVLLFVALSAYFIYTAYRAWKLGWQSRIILRAVVPGALFAIGLLIAVFVKWSTDNV